MRFTREENPEQVEQYSHIKPAPIFGPLRCFARCPGTHRTCTLSKGHTGLHVAHALFKKVAAVWDEQETGQVTSLELFKSRPLWNELPFGFLSTLASRLDSVQTASDFAELCEQNGILRDNITKIVNLMGDEPDLALGSIAASLTSYANTVAERKKFVDAKRALRLVLTLRPRHFPAWSSMALVSFFMGDSTTAVSWADKVLTFEPDLNSTDAWESAAAQAITPEGERLVGKALNDPGAVGAWKQIQQQMEAIKAACRK
jgi:hypothetical protein